MNLLLILMAGLIALTAGTLRAALRDHRRIVQAKKDGADQLLTQSDLRSESFRFAKHLLIFAGLAAMTDWGSRMVWKWNIDPIDFRNFILVTVGVLLGLNSALDLWSRHHSPHAPKVLRQDK
jgi:hypothetical protein